MNDGSFYEPSPNLAEPPGRSRKITGGFFCLEIDKGNAGLSHTTKAPAETSAQVLLFVGAEDIFMLFPLARDTITPPSLAVKAAAWGRLLLWLYDQRLVASGAPGPSAKAVDGLDSGCPRLRP